MFELLLICLIIILLFVILWHGSDRVGSPTSGKQAVSMADFPAFSGKREESVREFIEQVEREAKIKGYSEDDRVNIVISRLTGNARSWFLFFKGDASKVTWELLKYGLIDQYGNGEGEMQILGKLLNLKFEDGMDFENFAWKYREMYLRWRPNASTEDVVRAMLELLPGHISFLFHRDKNVTFPELLKRVRLYGNQKWYSEERNLQNVVPLRQRVWEVPGQPVGPRRQNFEPRRINDRTRINCFKCGANGHYARECSRITQGN